MESFVVFLGGKGVGKTSLIRSLWGDDIFDNSENESIVNEEVKGRGLLSYRVIEVTGVRFSCDPPLDVTDDLKRYLRLADVLVLCFDINCLSFEKQISFFSELIASKEHKEKVKVLYTLTKCDEILNSDTSEDDSEIISLDIAKKMLDKVTRFYRSSSSFSAIDAIFPLSSVVPVSSDCNWNLETLKRGIWDGVVGSLNSSVFDKSLPTIVFSGKTGSGKTSTLNLLWNLDFVVERSVSCTKYPSVTRVCDYVNGKKLEFNLVDLPGIAESVCADEDYEEYYHDYIRHADVLICLSQADRRTYKQDELFYKGLIDKGVISEDTKIVFGINQADLLFKSDDKKDGVDLSQIDEDNETLKDKANDFLKVFNNVFKGFEVSEDSVIIYSVVQNWKAQSLKDKVYSYITK